VLLYEGAKDERLLQSARTTVRGRGFNAAVVVVAGLAIRIFLGLKPAGEVAGLFGAWFLANLAYAAAVPALRRRGLLAQSLTLSVSLGALVISYGCWLAGGAEWLGLSGLILNLLFATLSLPKHSARKVYAVSAAAFAAYLALAAWDVLPAARMLPPHLGSMDMGHRLAAYIALVAAFVILCFSADFFTNAQDQREKSLRLANERLRGLNEQLKDKHFSLLCSQQDLILANEKLKLKSEEVLRSQDVIKSLVAAVEAKDNYTEGHSSRVAEAAVWLAREVGLNAQEQTLVKNGCILHDIGKINVSDLILRKNGPLSREEYEQMKRHPLIGEQVCKPLAFARPFLDIIRHHHERVDGKGYPDGLKGEEISLQARIAAIADAWDAMTSDRPYRKALSPSVAFSRLHEGAGTQWDEALVMAFIPMMQKRLNMQSQGATHA
jgi:putative nucleotidyltransferase with HDIG domain